MSDKEPALVIKLCRAIYDFAGDAETDLPLKAGKKKKKKILFFVVLMFINKNTHER